MKLTFRFTSSVSGTRSKSEHFSGKGALKCSIPRFCGKKIDEYLFECLDLSRDIFGGISTARVRQPRSFAWQSTTKLFMFTFLLVSLA